MNDELKELYKQVIIDHNRDPHNCGDLDCATHRAEGYNPLCGDKINVFLQMDGEKINDIRFQSTGCAISRASASLMTDAVKGKSIGDVREAFKKFQEMITAKSDQKVELESMGKLAVFAGVREFPSRVKCAGLAWHALLAAIDEKQEEVSTE